MALHTETVPTVSTASQHRTGTTLLVVSLVVAVFAALGLGAWVYVDHNGMPGAQAQSISVTTDHISALNAHDMDAVLDLSTDPASWMSSSYGVTSAGPYVGDAFVAQMQEQFDLGLTIDTSGPMVALSDGTMVSVAAQVSFTEGLAYTGPYDGILVYYLQAIDGELLVSHVVWTTIS
jgi:ketosteroid isomerase-like protein